MRRTRTFSLKETLGVIIFMEQTILVVFVVVVVVVVVREFFCALIQQEKEKKSGGAVLVACLVGCLMERDVWQFGFLCIFAIVCARKKVKRVNSYQDSLTSATTDQHDHVSKGIKG